LRKVKIVFPVPPNPMIITFLGALSTITPPL